MVQESYLTKPHKDYNNVNTQMKLLASLHIAQIQHLALTQK